jgi:hypothetical protein
MTDLDRASIGFLLESERKEQVGKRERGKGCPGVNTEGAIDHAIVEPIVLCLVYNHNIHTVSNVF